MPRPHITAKIGTTTTTGTRGTRGRISEATTCIATYVLQTGRSAGAKGGAVNGRAMNGRSV
ncbi:MAG: hypothetical protein GX857_13175, partial [Bacteroidales bacterium]|nr:hypothetical protein [Bacteroidales bacterium]